MSTIIELGKLVKQKFPGQFDDLSDIDLGRKIKLNNPGEFDDFTEVSKSTPRTKVAKTLKTAEKVLSVASDPVARKGMIPLAKQFTTDPAKLAELERLSASKDVVYGSDVLEELFPSIFESVPGQTWSNIGKTAAKIGFDIATDPLSYVGIGAPTKLGRLLRTAHNLKMAGQPVKLDSKLAREIAKEVGAAKPSPQMINNFLKMVPGKTASTQIAKGERSLLSYGIPFGKQEKALPFIGTGKVAGAIVKPLSMGRRSAIGAKIENTARDIFSTKSGDPDFDALISKFRSQVEFRKGVVIGNAKVMQKEFKELTRQLNITPEELNKHIRNAGEVIEPTTKKQFAKRYTKAVHDEMLASVKNGLVDAQLALRKAHAANDPDLIDKAAKQVVEYNSEYNRLSGTYKPPPSISPEIDRVVKQHAEDNAMRLFREQTSGVRILPMLADRKYVSHILTSAARKAKATKLQKEGKLPSKLTAKEFDAELGNAIRREFVEIKPIVVNAWRDSKFITKQQAKSLKGKDGLSYLDKLLDSGKVSEEQYRDVVHALSIDEVNALPAAEKVRIFGEDLPEIFITDPIFYTSVRGIEGEVARTSAEFFSEMQKRGMAIEDAAAPSNWINVRQAELKGFKVSPEIARVLNKWDAFNTNPESLKQVLKIYDRFHALTKAWTLAPFPAYHMLNAVGNVWNNFLAGVNNPDVYRQALMTQVSKLDPRYRPVNFTDYSGRKWNIDSLNDKARELGVIGKGQYGAEVQKTIQQELEKGKFLTLSSRSHFLRVGNRIGKFVEDNARMAHFIDRLRKGDTAEQAAASVKKFLFDYSDLTDIERQVFNRSFFFYTWTRKNIPLQLHSLVTTPGRFGLVYKGKHELEKNVPEANEKYLQDYLQDNFPLRLRYDTKTKQHEYFILNRWLPAADLLKLTRLHEIALNMVAPLPKETAQQLFNYDFFFKKKIETRPGQKVKFLGKDLPVKLVHGAKVIRLLNEIDKLTKEDSDFFTKAVGVMSGKNYMYNPTEQMQFNKSRVDKEIKDLYSAVYSEAAKGNTKEAERIMALIEEKVKEY